MTFIKSKLNGYVIDILGNSTAAGAELDAYSEKSSGIANQQWVLILDPAGSGYYFIKSKLNGNVIDVRGNSTAPATPLDAYPQKASGTANQLWQAVGGAFPTRDSAYLGLVEQHQQETEWCWSATTVSIELFYDPNSTLTQCELVNQAFNQTTCCQNPSSGACNQPWYPNLALTIVGHLASTASGKPTFQTITSQLNAGHPVSIAIYWTGGGGHNPAVDGYDDANAAQPTIELQDPWYGRSTQDFNSFPNSYQGGATWGESYFTH